MSRAQPLSEDEEPRLHQIVRELAFSAGIPMPRLYMIPGGPAERVRDRPQPEALGGGRHAGHHEAAQRGRAARRDRPRARARPQPRHPHDEHRGRDRRRDHLDRLHAAVVRRRRQPARARRGARDVAAGADRGVARSSSGSRASASTPQTRPGPASREARTRSRMRCERLEAGAQAMPMKVNQADGAALHREAVQRRRDRQPLLDPSPDRGARAPAPGDGRRSVARLHSRASERLRSRSFGNMKGAVAAASVETPRARFFRLKAELSAAIFPEVQSDLRVFSFQSDPNFVERRFRCAPVET